MAEDQLQKWSICVQCKEGIVDGQAWEREQSETDGIEHTHTLSHMYTFTQTCTHSSGDHSAWGLCTW